MKYTDDTIVSLLQPAQSQTLNWLRSLIMSHNGLNRTGWKSTYKKQGTSMLMLKSKVDCLFTAVVR